MKRALLAIACLTLTGCATRPSDVLKILPPGEYKNASLTVTGKFSATTGEAENVTVTEEGKVRYGKIHFRHSNAWIPVVEIKAEAK